METPVSPRRKNQWQKKAKQMKMVSIGLNKL